MNFITKVEIPVGTRLVINNKTVECVKRDQIDCEGCIFRQLNYTCEIRNLNEKLCLSCFADSRLDKTNVIFKEVEE